MANIITALDIGSSSVKGIIAEEKKDGTLSVLSAFTHPSQGMRKGLITDVGDFTNLVRDIIVDIGKISRHATKNIFVNLNNEHIKTRISRGVAGVARADREIQQDDLDRVRQSSSAIKLTPNFIILHNIVREYFVDDVGDIADPSGMTGNRLEISTLMIETFAPQYDLLVKSLKRAGATVGGVIFNPIAASRAVLSKRQKDLGVVLIDFGFGTTSFVVYEENKVMFAKSIPVGAGNITNDIAIGLRTSIDTAEKLKVGYGFAIAKDVSRKDTIPLHEFDPQNHNEVSRRFFAEIIQIRLEELLGLVNNELKALGRAGQLPGGTVITGGGVKLAGFDELVREELKLPVQTGFPNLAGFEITNPAHKELMDDPAFAVAVGLTAFAQEEGGVLSPSGPSWVKGFLRNLMP